MEEEGEENGVVVDENNGVAVYGDEEKVDTCVGNELPVDNDQATCTYPYRLVSRCEIRISWPLTGVKCRTSGCFSG